MLPSKDHSLEELGYFWLLDLSLENLICLWQPWPFSHLCCDSSEKAVAPHSSVLAWKIPWMEKPNGLQSMGSGRWGSDNLAQENPGPSAGVGLGIQPWMAESSYSRMFVLKPIPSSPPPFEDLLIIDNWSPASSMHHTRHLNIISKNITISTPFLKTLEVPVTQIPMTSCKPEWSPVVCPLLRPQLTQWVFTQSRRCSSSFTDSAQ